MLIYTTKDGETELAINVRAVKKEYDDFEYKGMTFRIPCFHIDWYKDKRAKINNATGHYSPILVLCEGNKWVYIASFSTKEGFIERCEGKFENPETRLSDIGVIEAIKNCLSPLFIPIIKE